MNFIVDVIQTGLSLDKLNAPFRPSTISLSADEIDVIIDSIGQEQNHRRIIPLIFHYLANKDSKTRWLEKTPTHIYSINEILQFVPDALFLKVVMDPRAILSSKKVRRESVCTERYTSDQQKFRQLEKTCDPLLDTLSRKSAIHAGPRAKQNYNGAVLTIHYQDLVTQKEALVRKICSFLKLEFKPTMLQIITRNTAYWEGRCEPVFF